jgi:hypothetical protein
MSKEYTEYFTGREPPGLCHRQKVKKQHKY